MRPGALCAVAQDARVQTESGSRPCVTHARTFPVLARMGANALRDCSRALTGGLARVAHASPAPCRTPRNQLRTRQ
jgi:hypothetical protein